MTTAPPVYPQHPGSPQLHQMAYEQPRLVHQQGQYFPPQSMQQQQQQDKQCQYQTATPLASLNRSPAPVDCPSCGERAMTVTSFESGNTTHAWAADLCCVFCLGCIPYLMDSLKDVHHECGRCGVGLATWHRSGSTEVHMHG